MRLPSLLLTASLFALSLPAQANGFQTFNEVGDASIPGDPFVLSPTGGLFDRIAGSLGAGGDQSDAFMFYFAGGAFAAVEPHFSMQLYVPGDPVIYYPGDPYSPGDPVLFYPGDPLIYFPGDPLVYYPGDPHLFATSNADGVLNAGLLNAGLYILAISGTAQVELPYAIRLFDPDTDLAIGVVAPLVVSVPEPGSLALAGLGLAAITGMRRRAGRAAQLSAAAA